MPSQTEFALIDCLERKELIPTVICVVVITCCKFARFDQLMTFKRIAIIAFPSVLWRATSDNAKA